MIVLVTANRKGGTGKTTSAVLLAHALHELGRRVLLVDADPQATALTWAEAGEWPLRCVGLPSKRLHAELPGIVGDRWDAVVVDTPPGDAQAAITHSALRAASHVVVPCAPTPPEYERLRVLWPQIEDAATMRTGPPPCTAVLLTRTIPNAVSTHLFRAQMERDGWRVLRTVVGRREGYAQAMSYPIERAAAGPYGDVLREWGIT